MKQIYFLVILSISIISKNAQAKILPTSNLRAPIQLNTNDTIIDSFNNLLKDRQYNRLIDKAEELEEILFQRNEADSLLISKIRHKKGYANYLLVNYQNAINNYNSALKILPKAEYNSLLHSKILFDRSYSEFYNNKRTDYYKSLKKAANILDVLENPDYGFSLEVYAELSYETKYHGYYEEAENYLLKGYAIIESKKTKTPKDVLFNYYSVSLYCSWQKEKEALLHLGNLETLKKTKSFNPAEKLMYAVSLNTIADYYIVNIELFDKSEALKKAEYYLNKAFINLDKDRNKNSYIQFKFNQNKLLLEKEQFNKVLKNVDELKRLTNETDTRRAFISAMEAKVFFKTKSKTESEKALLEMIKSIHNDSICLNRDFSNFRPSSTLHHGWLIAELTDEFLDAFPDDTLVAKRANQFYKLGLKQFKNCYWQSSFNKTNKEGYENILYGILNTGNQNISTEFRVNLLNDIENIENRLAWKAFLDNRTDTNIAIPDSLRRKELEFRKNMVLAIQKNDSERYKKEEEKLLHFNKFLNKNYPRIASFVYNNFDIEKFQKQLTKDQVVLRYKKFKDHFFLFIITQNDIEIVQLSDDLLINNTIETYINNLALVKNYKSIGKKLAQELIPINIDIYASVVVIPDGILHHLPFETLLNSSDEFLLEKHNISYASYLVFVNSIDALNHHNKNGLFVFSPIYNSNNETSLQGAKNEAERINKIFKGELFIGDKALKSHFINKASNANLLHLAMHANLNDENPELSYFSFTENETDNKVHLEELYALNLNAELAVLSACNTGKSNLENPEGAISLQRAFVFAGVPATISSLWQVPDKETSVLMVSFYENLIKAQGKDEALRNAKLAYLNSTDDDLLKHPYYWSGFIISGDVSPLDLQSDYTLIIIVILGVLLFLFMVRRQLVKRSK